MIIRKANAEDFLLLQELDTHILPEDLENAIADGRVLAAKKDGQLVGWLRWNLFWDNTPFMNLLYVLGPWRDRGVGQALTEAWEEQMEADGYQTLMLSTPSDEYSQHFYGKLGYKAIGGFTLPGEPYELMMAKER